MPSGADPTSSALHAALSKAKAAEGQLELSQEQIDDLRKELETANAAPQAVDISPCVKSVVRRKKTQEELMAFSSSKRKRSARHFLVTLYRTVLYAAFTLAFFTSASSTDVVSFGGCDFSVQCCGSCGSDRRWLCLDTDGGPLVRSGSCPTQPGELNLCFGGITSVPADAFKGMTQLT